MYLKSQFEETRVEVLQGLVKAYPLGTLIAMIDSQISVNHMPFFLSCDGGPWGTLKGHVPRANNLWKSLDLQQELVVVFQGPSSYITPSWYPSKKTHGKVVPTWNFAVVHVRGRPRVIEDAAWLNRHLNELTDEHEATQRAPWKVSDAPKDFIDEMSRLLVGIEIPIDSMIGKWKVSQNRPAQDRIGVADGLASRGDGASVEMARLVTERMNDSAKPR
jgi:transcriptional regulator